MTNVQFIKQNGVRKYAVVPIDLFNKLLAAAEDMGDVALYDKVKKNDDGFRVPGEIVTRELEGENTIRLWREHRRLTQDALSAKAGISKAYLSQLENGKRHGTMSVLRALSAALGVPFDVFVAEKA